MSGGIRMLVSVLASGSEGNCTYVETADAKILIDLGMNTKYITEKLNELGVSACDITHIIMTHTHSDHIGAITTFIKKYHPQICLTRNMYQELPILQKYENLNFETKVITVKNTKIECFKTSHDAIDSRGYIINDENTSLVYMTDTGYLNQKFFNKLSNKNIYIIESNHDVEMLLNGRYPKWLKTRILSDKGHLSNNAAGFYLSKLIGPKTKKVILAHLSHENNTKEEALKTVHKTLKEYDVDFKEIIVAEQRCKTEEIKL